METAQEIATNLASKLVKAERLAMRASELKKESQGEAVKLYDAMEDQGVPKIQIGEIEFKPDTTQDFSLDKDKVGTNRFDECESFFNWLEETDNAGIIKIKKTVHPGTRKKVLKEYIQDGGKLPDFIIEKFFSTVKWNTSLVKRLAIKS